MELNLVIDAYNLPAQKGSFIQGFSKARKYIYIYIFIIYKSFKCVAYC